MKMYCKIPDTIWIYGGLYFDSVIIYNNRAVQEDKFIEWYESMTEGKWDFNEKSKMYLGTMLKDYIMKYGIYQGDD